MRKFILLCFIVLLTSATCYCADTAQQVDFLISGVMDTDGTVVANGTVSFYVNDGGTTTKDVYSDINQTSVLSQPITLNDSGVPTSGGNPIAVYAFGFYRVVIKDSDGDTIQTISDAYYANIDSLSSFIDIDLLNDYGETQSDINNAIAYINANPDNHYLVLVRERAAGEDYAITADTTWPINSYILIKPGAEFNITSGKTLTFAGGLQATFLEKVFTGLGSVAYTDLYTPIQYDIWDDGAGTTINYKAPIKIFDNLWVTGNVFQNEIARIPSQYGTLSEALTAVGSSVYDLIIDGTVTMGAANSIPSTVKNVIFESNGVITGNYTLTHNGNNIVAAANQQIYGSDVTVTGNIANPINVKWFGALGDDTNDDFQEIQAAINLALHDNTGSGNYTEIVIPGGANSIYKLSAILRVSDNMKISGSGELKFYGGDIYGGVMLVRSSEQVWLDGFTINSNFQGNDNCIGVSGLDSNGGQSKGIKLTNLTLKNALSGSQVSANIGNNGGKGFSIQFGVENCIVDNIVIQNCDIGFSVEGKVGDGGKNKNIVITNVEVNDSKWMGAYLFGSLNEPDTGDLYDLTLDNIKFRNCSVGMGGDFGVINALSATNVLATNINITSSETGAITPFLGTTKYSKYELKVDAEDIEDVIDLGRDSGANTGSTTNRSNVFDVYVQCRNSATGYLFTYSGSTASYNDFNIRYLFYNGNWQSNGWGGAGLINDSSSNNKFKLTNMTYPRTIMVDNGISAVEPTRTKNSFNGIGRDYDSVNNLLYFTPELNATADIALRNDDNGTVFRTDSAGARFNGNALDRHILLDVTGIGVVHVWYSTQNRTIMMKESAPSTDTDGYILTGRNISGSGTPVGSVTPNHETQIYRDTDTGDFYMATNNATNNDWNKITN